MIKLLKKIFIISNKARIVIINTFFWGLLFLLLIGINSNKITVNRGESLYLNLSGSVFDSNNEGDIKTLLSSNGELPVNTVLSDVIRAISNAKTDNNINNIILDLDLLSYIGFGSMEEIGSVLKDFKSSGKEIFAFSTAYSQGQYYLASFADKIFMDPFGEVSLNGIGIYRNYWKDTFDKYGIDAKIFKAGEFKSYVEPYISNSMSSGVKRQNLQWMNSIWDNYTESVLNNRNIENFNDIINDKLTYIRKYNGDNSALALEEGIVDNLSTRDSFFKNYDNLYYYKDYLNSVKTSSSNLKVAVVSLEGTISYSDNSSGYISAVESEIMLDRVLTEEFDGLILRINSGGGGVFASETIRRKVQEISKDIPVIVSMGDICASGGYWIASAGERIFANMGTITGSIGVFGMTFGIEKALEDNFMVHSDGVGTSIYADKGSLTRNLTPEYSEIFQLSVDDTYNKFLTLVSESRNIDYLSLGQLAEGRVWSGKQALEHGLVDEIGGLTSAKNYIISTLNDDVMFVDIESEQPLLESLITGLFQNIKIPSILSSINNNSVVKELDMFTRIGDKKNIYALWY